VSLAGAARRAAAAALLALAALLAATPPAEAQGPSGRPTVGGRESAAARADMTETFERMRAETDRAREVIENDAASNQALDVMRRRLVDLRREARAIAERVGERAEPVRRELGALGDPPAEGEEETEIARLRATLNADLAEITAPGTEAQVLAERFSVLLEELAELEDRRLRERILSRGPSPLFPSVWIAAGEDLVKLASDIRSEIRASVRSDAWRAIAEERGPLALLAVAAALVIGVVAHRRALDWADGRARRPEIGRNLRVAYAAAAAAVRVLLPALGIFLVMFAIAALDLLGAKMSALLEGVSRAALPILLTYALASAYFAPNSPEIRLALLDDRRARIARRAALTLSGVSGLYAGFDVMLRTLRFDASALIVVNFVAALVAAYALLRLRWVYRPETPEAEESAEGEPDEPPGEDQDDGEDAGRITRQIRWLLRRALGLVAVVAPTLAALGYFAASSELLWPALRSLGVIGLCAIVHAISVDLSKAAEEEGATSKLLRIAPVIAAVLILLLAAPLLAMAWGASFNDVWIAAGAFLEGFDISGVRVSPLGFLTFIAVFFIGYALTGAVKRTLRSSVLPQLQVDKGARSALESGVGYAGVIIAALIAISVAGFDLSNLAIVAGALSVGVGFGLQTIVNNFVSGLILLAERPIKVGDWIEVNGIHGTVKKVNVRSTEIETFDRSAYIVPNSALISAPVTNYTHKNMLGRLIVKVGVAYRSDPREVEAILKKIARAHPMVLRRPEPMILFSAFGADALEFEVRCYLRDINYILRVGSDLHFSIAEAFREHGVEIPFGQRDIWFRNVSELGEALRPPGAQPIPLRAAEPEPPSEAEPPARTEAGETA